MAAPLRLNDREEKALIRIKEGLRLGTKSATVKYVILNYDDLNERYLAEKEAKNRALDECNLLKQKLSTFLNSFNELNTYFNPPKKSTISNKR